MESRFLECSSFVLLRHPKSRICPPRVASSASKVSWVGLNFLVWIGQRHALKGKISPGFKHSNSHSSLAHTLSHALSILSSKMPPIITVFYGNGTGKSSAAISLGSVFINNLNDLAKLPVDFNGCLCFDAFEPTAIPHILDYFKGEAIPTAVIDGKALWLKCTAKRVILIFKQHPRLMSGMQEILKLVPDEQYFHFNTIIRLL